MLELNADGLNDAQISEVQEHIDRLRKEVDHMQQRDTPPSDAEEVLAIMKRLRESGIAEKFGDPVEWQREIRRESEFAEHPLS